MIRPRTPLVVFTYEYIVYRLTTDPRRRQQISARIVIRGCSIPSDICRSSSTVYSFCTRVYERFTMYPGLGMPAVKPATTRVRRRQAPRVPIRFTTCCAFKRDLQAQTIGEIVAQLNGKRPWDSKYTRHYRTLGTK